MRKGLCNSIAFYNFEGQVDVKGIYEYTVELFKKHNNPPTRFGLSHPTIKAGKTKTFKHGDKKIRELEFKGITAIELYAPPPDHNDDMFDAIFLMHLRLKQDDTGFILGFDNAILGFDLNTINSIAKDIAGFLNPGYGIAYQRDFDKGPSLYAYGVIGNEGYSDEEEKNIAKWMHIYGDPERYREGDLRDIYPYNFLSEAHLVRNVGDKTLKEWIMLSSEHGTLTPLTEKLWTWEVPQENISSVRELLRPTGIVKCI